MALEEETQTTATQSVHLVKREHGVEVVIGDSTRSDGDGFRRLMSKFPIPKTRT